MVTSKTISLNICNFDDLKKKVYDADSRLATTFDRTTSTTDGASTH